MADKHTSETHYLFLKEKGKSYAQRKRLYFNRAFSSDCHYRIIDGNIDAHTKPGKETVKISRLSDEPASMGRHLVDVLPG